MITENKSSNTYAISEYTTEIEEDASILTQGGLGTVPEGSDGTRFII